MFVSQGGNEQQYIKSLQNHDYYNFIKKKKFRIRKMQANIKTPNDMSPMRIDKTINLSAKVSMREFNSI